MMNFPVMSVVDPTLRRYCRRFHRSRTTSDAQKVAQNVSLALSGISVKESGRQLKKEQEEHEMTNTCKLRGVGVL